MSKPRIKPGTAVEVEWDASKCECCGKQRNAWRVSQDGELVGHYGYVTIDNTTRHTLEDRRADRGSARQQEACAGGAARNACPPAGQLEHGQHFRMD